MLKGFRDFVLRGNVVDLAVGIVIGAAFATLVGSFSESFLTPIINMIGVGGDGIGGVIALPGENNYIKWGAFISAVIAFVMTAAVVYFLVVLPMNRLAEMRKRGEVEEPSAPSEEILLLTEIRDALLAGKGLPQPRESVSEAKVRQGQ